MNQGRRKAQQIRKHRMLFFIGILLIIAGAMAIPLLAHFGENSGELAQSPGEKKPFTKPKEEKAIELRISCVGDVMAHQTQIVAQKEGDTYNFENNFVYMKPYIEAADLAICNVETPFAGGKPTGYPAFNAPDSLADALKKAGFDVAITANNHMMDKGFSGMQRTLETLRKAELATTGSCLEGEKNSYTIEEVKGVKIGVIAYTYETAAVNGRRTINSNPLSADAKALINSFSYNSLDSDLVALKENIRAAKEEGAEIILCYFHWGEEYQRSPNQWQQSIAQTAADMGADIIFASHPHVVQGVEMLTSGEGEAARQVPVFYSMGNFISNQRRETLGENRYTTEQEIMATVTLNYKKSTGKITDISMKALPIWLDRYQKDGKYAYYLIPLNEKLEENKTLKESGHLDRARQARAELGELIGEENIE